MLEVNPSQRWARVEPGVVLDELNRQLRHYGLMFAPDVSTSNRATVGGMMANNSYCYVISNLKSESSIPFRKDLNRTTIADTLKAHNATIQRKAFDLR